jgi:hypothetical protein
MSRALRIGRERFDHEYFVIILQQFADKFQRDNSVIIWAEAFGARFEGCGVGEVWDGDKGFSGHEALMCWCWGVIGTWML